VKKFLGGLLVGLVALTAIDVAKAAGQCPWGQNVACDKLWCEADRCMCHKNSETGGPECVPYQNPDPGP